MSAIQLSLFVAADDRSQVDSSPPRHSPYLGYDTLRPDPRDPVIVRESEWPDGATVAQLRAFLAGIPGDLPVYLMEDVLREGIRVSVRDPARSDVEQSYVQLGDI